MTHDDPARCIYYMGMTPRLGFELPDIPRRCRNRAKLGYAVCGTHANVLRHQKEHMTYDEMTAVLGVTRCRGRTPSGHYCDQQHDKEGSVDRRGVEHGIHFSERPVKRAATLAFLELVARVEEPSIDFDAPWRRVYRMNMAVRDLASRLHIQNPARPATMDRAFVLASVASLDNTVPMRRQAFDWARRGPKR